MRILKALSSLVCLLALCGLTAAAVQNDTVQVSPAAPSAQGTVPVFRVTVVGANIDAVNFHVRGGETTLNLVPTPLLPDARGKAEVQVQRGAVRIESDFSHVTPAQKFGPEFLTYVMWAITPDGRATNLGEVQLLGNSAKLNVTTPLQNFGLIVTAEPYFGVSHPSNYVVLQSEVRPDTTGEASVVRAHYQLLGRGEYTLGVPQSAVTPIPQTPKVPLDYFEAENAVRIAQWAGAERNAPDMYAKAKAQLEQARSYLERDAGIKPLATVSREAVQTAEDARLTAIRTRLQQEAAARQAAILAREHAAHERAEQAQSQAAQAQAQAAQAQAQAEAARQAREHAEAQAEAARQQSAQLAAQTQQMRERLQAQLNSVLATRATARGLIMSMSDVLFNINRYTLKPDAQIKLAKVAGILMAYPDLNVAVNGYTDSTGTPEYNQQLSEKRAAAVRDFLVSQGVRSNSITAQGFGQDNPVAPNSTPAGRQQNRRVEMVVSGAAIGIPTSGPSPAAPAAMEPAPSQAPPQ